jgi:tetratricopeptide (TPR) repeat protein
MNTNHRGAFVKAAVFLALLAGLGATPARAQDDKPAYTREEYDAYTAAAGEKDPQQKIKLLDQFTATYPSSTLLPYALEAYYSTYNQLKNYPKTIEYADRYLALGDKLDTAHRLQALSARTLAFLYSFSEKEPNAEEILKRARQAALEGVQDLEKLPKPENVTEEQYAQQKKPALAFFDSAAGFAALQLKDYAAAAESFNRSLAANPNDAMTSYRLGIAYLQMQPPQHVNGFWALARAVALKGPMEAQARTYLRSQMLRYQTPTCENLLDGQLNELLTLAASSPERPANYNFPSAADLQKIRETSGSILDDLKTNGEHAKHVWLAVCGLEFPEVVVKVIAATVENDAVQLKGFRSPSQEEMEAATQSNMVIKVIEPPEAKRLKKDDWVRFSGTLTGLQADPFLLSWEKAKINPEDIPDEKAPPGKRPRPPAKKPRP